MTRKRMQPEMMPILINYADSIEWQLLLNSADVGGRGFKIAKQVNDHAKHGCNKISYSCLVPGLLVLHAPSGYLKSIQLHCHRAIQPVRATRPLLEKAIRGNAGRFGMTIDETKIDYEISLMLTPSSPDVVFEIGCSPGLREGVYNELCAKAA